MTRGPCWIYTIGWDLHHPGGVNEVIRNLFDRTATQLDHSPLLVVRAWDRTQPVTSTIDGRRTVHVSWPTPWAGARPVRCLTSFLWRLPRALNHLRFIVRSEHVAVVHVHFPAADALIWPLVRRMGSRPFRLVLSFHGLDLKGALEASAYGRIVWRLVLRAADHITVCSSALAERLTQTYPSCRHKVHVIENGVDVERVQLVAAAAPSRELPRDFVFSAGTYESKKGHDVVMAAFDRVAARWPDLGLIITGRYDAPEYRRLDALRRSLAAGSRIELLRDLSHEETMKLMRRTRCFVLASREEPFGIVVLEAGALGRPVICTTACGVIAHLDGRRDVSLVAPDDAVGLATALENVLADDSAAEAMGTRLHRTVVEKLDWRHIIHRYAMLAAPMRSLQSNTDPDTGKPAAHSAPSGSSERG